jgi:hypothetical protein
MNSPDLSLQIATILAPALPVLLAGTEIAAKAFTEEIGKDAWKQVKDCWNILRTSAKKDVLSDEAVAEVSKIPDIDGRVKSLSTLIQAATISLDSGARIQLAKYITNINQMHGGHIGDN